ncbi:MAG TPA: cysteine--tRNA ligase [Candidatus Babeliales bacterium]|nr:cysteine--tRNA ligase [Candidatus Babeliales bacterium]
MIRLFNTLGRHIQDFEPMDPNRVKLYTCGPTVYDFAQIGNLRAFVFNDTLRRTLESAGYRVRHVMNITDVGHLSSDADSGEDKLEKGAKREGKTVWDVADFYIRAFEKDTTALNILPPNGYHGKAEPYARATDFINEQQDIIGLLLDKGFAYITEQAIYFETAKMSDYGKLTGQKSSDKEVAARPEVVVDNNKKSPQDFALWFFTVGRFASHSMHWTSPWGEGFPGWHLECSAIIHSTLKEPIDIHTGGVDHIGTHHTNEIAQTEAAFGTKLANFWVHNEHLLVQDEKMSKSKGNFFTLEDVIKRGFEPLALRLLFLQSHYRKQTNFRWESLSAASSFLKNLQAWADLKFQDTLHKNGSDVNYGVVLEKIKECLFDDLNTPETLAVLSQFIQKTEKNRVAKDNFQTFLEHLDELFGLDLSKRADVGSEIKSLINQRQIARQNENWSASDALRNSLLHKGVEINDTEQGQIWRRV